MLSFLKNRLSCAITSLLLLQGLHSSAIPAIAQCCGGAQNIIATSHDGRYQVEATSLTGTGHHCHGPYHYRFRTSRISANGEPEPLGVFERAWDKDNHFSMTICVSPTGNGFAIGSTFDDPILFFSPEGTLLAKIAGHQGLHLHRWNERDPPLIHSVTGRTQYGSRTTKIWLPLFHVTGPETEWISDQRPSVVVAKQIGFKTIEAADIGWLLRMLKWRPGFVVTEAAHVSQKIRDSDKSGLIELGLSALPIIEAQLATEENPTLRSAQREIILRLCGHRDAWRNLELLIALQDHPNAKLRDGAVEALRRLLPEGELNAEWVRLHRDQLKWDEQRHVYRQ